MRGTGDFFNPDYALGSDEDDESIETEKGAQRGGIPIGWYGDELEALLWPMLCIRFALL